MQGTAWAAQRVGALTQREAPNRDSITAASDEAKPQGISSSSEPAASTGTTTAAVSSYTPSNSYASTTSSSNEAYPQVSGRSRAQPAQRPPRSYTDTMPADPGPRKIGHMWMALPVIATYGRSQQHDAYGSSSANNGSRSSTAHDLPTDSQGRILTHRGILDEDRERYVGGQPQRAPNVHQVSSRLGRPLSEPLILIS